MRGLSRSPAARLLDERGDGGLVDGARDFDVARALAGAFDLEAARGVGPDVVHIEAYEVVAGADARDDLGGVVRPEVNVAHLQRALDFLVGLRQRGAHTLGDFARDGHGVGSIALFEVVP